MSFWESPSIPNKCRLLRTNEGFGAIVIKGRPIGATRRRGKGTTHRFHKSSLRSLMGRLQAHEPLPICAIFKFSVCQFLQIIVNRATTFRYCANCIPQEPASVFLGFLSIRQTGTEHGRRRK